MARSKVSHKQLLSVYQKKGGNVSATCLALNISRTQFYKMKNKSEKLAEMLGDVDESLIDFAESKLMEKVQDGDITSIIFLLKTKGKKRGYVETVEQNVTVNPFEELMKALPDED